MSQNAIAKGPRPPVTEGSGSTIRPDASAAPTESPALSAPSGKVPAPAPEGASPRRPSGLNRVSKPSGRVAAPEKEAFGAPNVREFLSKVVAPARKATRDGLVAEVGRVTYLVADGDLEGGSRAGRLARQLVALVKAHPALAVPPAAFLLVCGLAVNRMIQPPPRFAAASPTVLTVFSCAGAIRPSAGGQPLVSGDVLRASESFVLEPSAVAKLAVPAGDRLKLTGPGKFTIEPFSAGEPPRFVVECAGIEYDARCGSPLHLRLGHSVITSPGVAFSANRTAGGYVVEARAAGVAAHDGASSIDIAPNTKRELP